MIREARCRHCGITTTVTPAERERVLQMHREGYRRCEIIEATRLSGKTVDRITATLRALAVDDGQIGLFKGVRT